MLNRMVSPLKVTWLLIVSMVVLTLSAAAQTDAVKFDSETISGLGARNLGPATMSGRVAAMDAVEEKGRITLYVGAASGGIWKSVNGGTTFKPIFDKHPMSIGALAIDPSNPKTVWAGTGESWVRNSVSAGEGIYKTIDSGENWEFMGLKDTERISRVIVDPKNGNTVYVCATGALWNDSKERGVFKTTDGGKSWNKVLAGANDSTGCAMITMDSQDSNILYASMWQFRRKGWTFTSGGPGSDILKTTDGGANWKSLKKANGLPEGEWGRIALAAAPSRPSTIYAMVEAKSSALFRSDDFGANWVRLDNSQNMIWRAFYFAHIYVDPKNHMKVYKPGLGMSVSNDGGRTFSGIAGSIHSDFHAVWINPNNPEQLFVGDDGGVAFSEDAGNKWRFLGNLPISQFYHVSYDMQKPYNVYGGLQDNSSWVGPSDAPGGITNGHWENMYGGDGFWMFADPSDQDYIYAEAQGGYLGRIHRKTHETKDIRPYPNAGEKKFRFNWNTPIHLSPNEKGTIYFGAQYLFRSRNHGESWDRISPDLTTNDPEKQKQEESGGITIDNSAAEMHTTIYSISESPKNGQVIWAGTDDGNIQVTRDGGKSWTNVVGNVPGAPKNTWVSTIEASRFDEATAYVTLDGHTLGDFKTHIFKTADFGKTWQSLTPATPKDPKEKPAIWGYAHVIKEDVVNKDLLFAGTETGLFVSLDGGKQWAQFKGGDFPSVAVRDIAVHPREHDLILATHGRGIWIVDDITPLRALTPEMLNREAAFLPAKPTEQKLSAQGGWFPADSDFVAPGAPEDALITYYQKKRHIFGDLKIEIFDAQGKLLNTIPGSKRRGLNRATWSMRLPAPKFPSAAAAVFGAIFGPRVLPGTYTVKMTKGKEVYTTELNVVPDPRVKHTAEDRKFQYETAVKLYDMLGHMTYEVDAITALRDQLQQRASKVDAKDPLRKKLEDVGQQVDGVRSKIVATKEGGAITGEERIREFMGELYGNINFFDGRPTDSQLTRIAALGKELGDIVAEFEALTKKELATINGALEKKKLDPVKVLTKDEWEKKSAKK